MISISGLEAKQYYVTEEGAEELRDLLKHLQVVRIRLLDEVRSLASQSGNVLADPLQAANFHKAEEMEVEIRQLQRILAMAKIIPKPALPQLVQLGSRVTVKMGGREHTYTILGSIEADPLQGKISNESPLGRLLLGKKLGDTFDMAIGDRHLSAKIVGIE
jgi:transcription elongation factor GreA